MYDMRGPNTISVWGRNLQRFCQIQVKVDGWWEKNWFKYVEGQTLGNIIGNLLVLPVRYVSVLIQRRSDTLRLWNFVSGKPVSMPFLWVWSRLLSVKKPWISRAVKKTIKFEREIEYSENRIVNYLEGSLDLKYTSLALKRYMKSARIFETSEWKFRIVIQKCRDLFVIINGQTCRN